MLKQLDWSGTSAVGYGWRAEVQVPSKHGCAMTGLARCVHIDLEGSLKGHRVSYRAHIEVSGGESLDESVNDLVVEFRRNESWPLANAAWNQMTAAEDQALNQVFREDIMSAYLMKRVRGELIDESFAGHPWKDDEDGSSTRKC